MRRLVLSAAIVAMSGPAWGEASDLYEDEVISLGQVIGDTSRSKLTSPTSVLTESEIRARGQNFIGELLRSLPGLAVSNSGSASGLTQLRVRGSEANQTIILIDGVEVANPTDGGFDFGGLRAEDVIKIDVLRGEQSALYGASAIGGVINIITRAGKTEPGWRTFVEGGSRDAFTANLGSVIPLGETAALSINGTVFGSTGYDISGLDGERDGDSGRNLNLGLNEVELGPLTFDAKYQGARRVAAYDEDSDFDGRLNDTDSETTVDTELARMGVGFDLGPVENRINLVRVETDVQTEAGFSTRSIGTRSLADWAASYRAGAHTISLIAEAEVEAYELVGDPDMPELATQALAADYRFDTAALNMTGSVRQDFNENFKNATTWRIGAGYGFGWNGRLRGSVGTAVVNPSLTELFGFFPAARFTGNPELQPESSIGVSLGYEQTFGNFVLSLDVFRSELKNEIVPNSDFTTVLNLESDSTREGLEIEARWSLADTLFLRGSASFLDSEQEGRTEIRRPDFLASGTASWTATEALTLSISVDHNGEQLDTDFATFTDVELDSFTLIGANARYEINDIVALTLRGSNLLDEEYQELVGYASPGRAVFAGVGLSF